MSHKEATTDTSYPHPGYWFDQGMRAGIARASWSFDGNTSLEAYARVLQGVEHGDPQVVEEFDPGEPLSGEHAGGSLSEIFDDPAPMVEWMEAYEEGYAQGYWHELERVCRLHLGEQ